RAGRVRARRAERGRPVAAQNLCPAYPDLPAGLRPAAEPTTALSSRRRRRAIRRNGTRGEAHARHGLRGPRGGLQYVRRDAQRRPALPADGASGDRGADPLRAREPRRPADEAGEAERPMMASVRLFTLCLVLVMAGTLAA